MAAKVHLWLCMEVSWELAQTLVGDNTLPWKLIRTYKHQVEVLEYLQPSIGCTAFDQVLAGFQTMELQQECLGKRRSIL